MYMIHELVSQTADYRAVTYIK